MGIGERERDDVSFCCEDIVVHVERKVVVFRE
jgi:hypothetical protein